MKTDITNQLLKLNFVEKRGFYNRGTPLKQVVGEVKGSIIVQVAVLDPFHDDNEPFFPVCISGSLCEGGITTRSAFLTNYEVAEGNVTQEVEAFEKYVMTWFDRFSTFEKLTDVFEDSFQRRKLNEVRERGVGWKLFEKMVGTSIKNGKPGAPYPPIYDYLKSLLYYHQQKYVASLTHADRYLATLKYEGDEDARKRVTRMVHDITAKN